MRARDVFVLVLVAEPSDCRKVTKFIVFHQTRFEDV